MMQMFLNVIHLVLRGQFRISPRTCNSKLQKNAFSAKTKCLVYGAQFMVQWLAF